MKKQKAAHTSGPWLISYANAANRPASINGPAYSVASFNAALWDRNWVEATANAHLIAAAPELLEALEKIRVEAKELELDTVLMWCDEATSKAKGGGK